KSRKCRLRGISIPTAVCGWCRTHSTCCGKSGPFARTGARACMKKGGPTANLLCENHVREQGYERIVGIDEAGRGTWAGPVVAAAVCLPLDRKNLSRTLAGVRDSKDMS